MTSISEETKTKPKKVTKTTDQSQGFDLKAWVADLYDVSKLSDEELAIYYEALRYKGFNRDDVLRNLAQKVGDKSLVIQLVLVSALQGPVRASKTKLSNGRTPFDLGISASGQKGTQNISCQRITAATADLAAYLLKRLNVPKRLDHPCPAWLQFPSAGSIKLPEDLRRSHRDFAEKFSSLIGGVFNEQIYSTMMTNAYLDERLGLFGS